MLVVLTTTAVAGDPEANSANHYLAACRELASQQSPSQSFAQGECIGVIAALSYVAKDLPADIQACISRVTNAQLAAVVVDWLDHNPERWREDFRSLVLEALHDRWPCI